LEIHHHVALSKQGVEKVIKNLGLKYKYLSNDITVIIVDINESDKHWHLVNDLIHEEQAVNLVETIFNRSEILNEPWIRLRQRFRQGFPQPETGWDEITYKNYCPKCGAGYSQLLLSLLKNPEWVKRTF